jgi:hypothetical protein
MKQSGGRRGGLALEALVALLLGLVVMVAFTGVAVSSLRGMQALQGRSEALEIVRTVWVVLDEELRQGRVGRDWDVAASGESVRLRAFRGVARICDSETDDEPGWVVAFRGRRLPDPGRDSLLVLGADGGWRPFALEHTAPSSGCEPEDGEVVQRWRWSSGVSPPPVVARTFERGEYHLADGALRYRRGSAGRQPLTPERLSDESGFQPIEGGVEVIVAFPGEVRRGDPPVFRWSVAGEAWSDPEGGP